MNMFRRLQRRSLIALNEGLTVEEDGLLTDGEDNDEDDDVVDVAVVGENDDNDDHNNDAMKIVAPCGLWTWTVDCEPGLWTVNLVCGL